MSKVVIRVKYEKGVLKPLEELELKEGEEVRIRIEKSLKERPKTLLVSLASPVKRI
ncbi:MAG: DUF104 domain-containing protein [Desulfurococcales archaeon]|nr:DUF104 domain-containing protein [Desulfurococcales archaeon]